MTYEERQKSDERRQEGAYIQKESRHNKLVFVFNYHPLQMRIPHSPPHYLTLSHC